MQWRYGKATKGMYLDGHEQADVVEYCKGFLVRMQEYQKRMTTHNQDGNILLHPTGIDIAAGKYPLVEITQDESTFMMYDRHWTKWDHVDAKQPEEKNEGPSLMILGMLTQEWGKLKHGDQWVQGNFDFLELLTYWIFYRTSQVVFKACKNHDGYFDNDDLVKQVELSMDIFEEKTHGFKRALFLFDNATSHQKRAPDAPSARKMWKSPKLSWTACPGGPKMRDTVLPDGSIQSFYHPEDHPTMPGWFKGMQAVLDERGLFRYKENGKGMNGECKDFKYPDGVTDCCCCRILFNQLDFVGVKSHLEEVINSRGHLCDFYPKFYCELNYIKQYWGAVKLLYRCGPWLKKMEDMEKQVVACLSDISLMQIQR